MTPGPPNPPQQRATGIEQLARCWQCGYLLRGIQSRQCPECGRPFDRADPASMNFAQPMGRLGRWMLAPLGRGVIALAILGLVLICASARWPVEGWRFSLVDLRYYGDVTKWR